MAYLYLAAAIIFEILGTMSMKYSEGFTKVVPSILTFVCSGICFVGLTLALKTLPVSNVYAIWAGVGTAIMAVVGMYYFNEPLHLQKVLATSLIILGVVLLNLGPAAKVIQKDQMAKVEENQINRLPAKVQVATETERNAG
jgi:small multidrug resistance pump